VVHDGSLSGPSSQNAEVVSPILKYEDIESFQEVIRALRRAGGRVNESCSVHCHVGAENFTVNAIKNLIRSVAKNEDLIEHVFQVSESRKARYCKSIDPAFLKKVNGKMATMKQLNEAWYGFHNTNPQRYDGSRYRAVNLNSYFLRSTIEFRFFQGNCGSGTIHAGKVKAIIHFVLALCARAMKVKNCSAKVKPFDSATAKYDFRVLLLALNLSGDEFRVTRKHLIGHLEGSAAWKHGRPERLREAA